MFTVREPYEKMA